MRDIKFRAWGDCNMTYMEDFTYSNSSDTENEQLGEFLTYNHSCELMQYTGLKDKNGVEIYEGDIINEKEHYIGDYLIVEQNHEIEFGDGSFNICFADIQNNNIEVIGNIYENPELL